MTDCFVFPSPIDYPQAVQMMEERILAIKNGEKPDTLWFLEHPDVYTAGISALPEELKDPRFPVYKTNRGGKYTWHGKGQRVIYVMYDLAAAGLSPKNFVALLEKTLSDVLGGFGIETRTYPDRIGLWVTTNGKDEKIAALGVRVKRGVSYHGLAVNIRPDLGAFNGIVPCGLSQYGVTSLEALGVKVSGVDMLDRAFAERFARLFNTEIRFSTTP